MTNFKWLLLYFFLSGLCFPHAWPLSLLLYICYRLFLKHITVDIGLVDFAVGLFRDIVVIGG